MRNELEKAILGACLLELEAFGKAASILKSKNFSNPINQQIWAAMESLWPEHPIDLISVAHKLGPSHYPALVEYTINVNSSANIAYHSMLVLQLDIQDKALSALQAVKISGLDDRSLIQRKAIQDAKKALQEKDPLLVLGVLEEYLVKAGLPVLSGQVKAINQALSARAKEIVNDEKLKRVERIYKSLKHV